MGRWAEVVSDVLWNIANQYFTVLQIERRKRQWIGHTLRKPEVIVGKEVLDWNLQGARGRTCPRKIWKRTIQEEPLA
jgi:hypothetical protein